MVQTACTSMSPLPFTYQMQVSKHELRQLRHHGPHVTLAKSKASPRVAAVKVHLKVATHEKKRKRYIAKHQTKTWAKMGVFLPSVKFLTPQSSQPYPNIDISTLTSWNHIMFIFMDVLWTTTHSETTYKAVCTLFKSRHTGHRLLLSSDVPNLAKERTSK